MKKRWLKTMEMITVEKTEVRIWRAKIVDMSSKEENHRRNRPSPSRRRQMPMLIGTRVARLECEDCHARWHPRETIGSTMSSHTTPFSLGADTACGPRGGTCRIGG